MFSLQDVKCDTEKKSRIEPLLRFQAFDEKNKPLESIRFENNTLYFIIGESGVGKSTLLSFLTSPFSEDPIKNGAIHFDAVALPLKKEENNTIKIENSTAKSKKLEKAYFAYLRNTLAFIPQMTDSFHPSIPILEQLKETFEAAAIAPSPSKFQRLQNWVKKVDEPVDSKPFRDLVKRLGERAGFTRVEVSEDLSTLKIWDKKEYEDKEGEPCTIVDIGGAEGRTVVLEGELSSGQLQRLLVLKALIQFETANVLFGDEFLVNFSFLEGNKVLDGLIEAFKERKETGQATAAFVFHDLSYPCIRQQKDDVNARVMLLEETPESKAASQNKTIAVRTIPLRDFWSEDLPQDSPFFRFRQSYQSLSGDYIINPKNQPPSAPVFEKNIYESYTYPGKTECVYENLHFEIKENRFIILTGFSGCGKSTFCKQLIETIPQEEKWKYRYFPSRTREALSFGSQVRVEEDLRTIYGFYNHIKDVRDEKERISRHFRDVELFQKFEAFLQKPIFSLSGGELQRYWFARITLLEDIPPEKKPKLLVFDESVSSLDCVTKDILIKFVVERLFVEENFAVLFITHDLRDIGVICQNLHNVKRTDLFEHYELFNKKLYRVKTPSFKQYWDNILDNKFNDYEESGTGTVYHFKLKEVIRKP
ncbi:MAG: ATP-binding cassette domain-containing protein [Treponema sp.]|jgi:ABC-type dipeptide/oligopeptide/nickel transport system ATPase subunit|nr:ATP-binding cassette domain-containing protein [Treponema sp.]